MNNYRAVDQLRSFELIVERRGFWNPEYFLTDGQFEYGRLSRVSFSSCEKIIEIANNTYTMRRAGAFSKETLLLKNDQVIGKTKRNAWKYTVDLELNDGFSATFMRTPGRGFFSSNLSWITNGVELMMISCKRGYSTPMTVSVIDQSLAKQGDHLLLLAFIGVHIRLVRQAQAAAQ